MAGSDSELGSGEEGDEVRRGELVMHDVREELERLQDSVLAAVTDAGFDEPSTFAVRLALEEAVANAFRHGNAGDPDKTVTVRYEVTPHEIHLSVQDEGTGFDPGAVPDPTEDENLEIPSGRGIMLMRAYMTSVEIVAPGNRIDMTFRRD